jgi:esterase/lipase superfamily enzyme
MTARIDPMSFDRSRMIGHALSTDENAALSRGWLKRAARLVGCALLATVLSACAARNADTLLPVQDTSLSTSAVDMIVATTRAKSDKPGVVFSGERATALSFTNIVISIPPEATRRIGEVAWPRRYPGDPSREFVALKVQPVAFGELQPWFHRHSGPKRRAFVFVHGYNTRYEEAVFRFAQIVHDSETSGAPILFSWPSRGNPLGYAYDRESANYSRTDLETVLQEAVTKPDVDEVVIMAHSMGGWLTIEALRQMSIRNGGLPGKIKDVILAAPDLDVDVFRRQMQDIHPDHTRFTLFVSKDDRALGLSRLLGGGIDRVGAIDPSKEPYRSAIEETGITVINLSDLQAGDPSHHVKFAESGEVVKLIGRRLLEGQKISDGDLALSRRMRTRVARTTRTAKTSIRLPIGQ